MSGMTNRLLAIGGVAVLLGFLTMLILPAGHIPLLDANRQVLAETERAGYCAGSVYINSRGQGGTQEMKDCMSLAVEFSNEIDHTRVQTSFCRGVISEGLQMTIDECMKIMEVNRLWPTMKGQLTDAWNRRFNYPGATLTINQPQTGDPSRTGDRTGNTRQGGLR